MISYELASGRRISPILIAIGLAGTVASATGLLFDDWRLALMAAAAFLPFYLPGLRDLFFDSVDWGVRIWQGYRRISGGVRPVQEKLTDANPLPQPELNFVPPPILVHSGSLSYEISRPPGETADALAARRSNEARWRKAIASVLAASTYYGFGVEKMVDVARICNSRDDWTKVTDVMRANKIILKTSGKTTRLYPGLELQEAIAQVLSDECPLSLPDTRPPFTSDRCLVTVETARQVTGR